MYFFKVSKKSIPYEGKILIEQKIYFIDYKYNIFDERIYARLKNSKKEILTKYEPLALGVPLWSRLYVDNSKNIKKGFPKILFIPVYLNTKLKKPIFFSNVDKIVVMLKEI